MDDAPKDARYPYECQRCGIGYAVHSDLARHMQRHYLQLTDFDKRMLKKAGIEAWTLEDEDDGA